MGLLNWLHTSLVSMVSRGKVTDAQRGKVRNMVQLQLLNGEQRDRVEYIMPYGMSALPAAGSDAIMLTVGGTRDDVVAIAVADPSKQIRGLALGEFGFSDANSTVVFKTDRLAMRSTMPIAMQSDATIYVTGQAVALGALGAAIYRLMDERMIALFNSHTHGGVLTGTGHTAVPDQTLATGTHSTTTVKSS